MIGITGFDHVGVRIRDKERSIAFYQALGFELISDMGFDQGHPVIMRHTSGFDINLLGPTSEEKDENILMDVEKRHAGYTHIALRVASLAEAETFLESQGIAITGRFTVKTMSAIFIRDPDRNVIELDEPRNDNSASGNDGGYDSHP